MHATALTTGLIVGAAVLYTASGAMATRALARGEGPDAPTRRRLGARVTLALGALALTAALVHATALAGHLPVFDVPGACLVLIWTASCVFVAFDRTAPIPGLGPVLFPVVLLLFAAGGLLTLRGDAPPAEGSQALVAVHVLMALSAYAAFLLAAGAGVLYLVQQRAVRRGVATLVSDQLPSLQRLDRLTFGLLLVGLPLLTVALLVGLGQAHALGARALWADPTVASAVVLWAFYAVVLLLRGTARVRGRKVAWATIVGFVAVLATFLGTSLLGDHDHPTRRVAGAERRP
jgi:ABC-type uncharacterized transport system permease subunit